MPTIAPTRIQDARNLVWLDLEMTGLDPDRDVILQAAVVITDDELRPLEEFVCDVWQPPELVARMSPFVRDMHTTSGLLARLPQAALDVRAAERELLIRVAGWCPCPATLCGNSIWNDRQFLERSMPGMARYFHHRLLDVTALKLVAQIFFGEGAEFAKPEAGRHEALADARASIAELAHYRKTILRNRPVGV
jgi:oligoribonuclease